MDLNKEVVNFKRTLLNGMVSTLTAEEYAGLLRIFQINNHMDIPEKYLDDSLRLVDRTITKRIAEAKKEEEIRLELEKKEQSAPGYLTTATNDEDGWKKINHLRSLAKRNGLKVIIRGRNNNRKQHAFSNVFRYERDIAGAMVKYHELPNEEKLNQLRYSHNRLRRSIPKSYATYFAVYLQRKDGSYVKPTEYNDMVANKQFK